MARLFQCGAEIEASSNSGGPDGGTQAGTVTRDTATFRAPGVASFKFDSGVGNAVASKQSVGTSINQTNGVSNFCRFYLNIPANPTATAAIFAFATSAASGTIIVKLTTTGTLQLWNGTTAQLGSDSAALTAGTWYRVEVSGAWGASGATTGALLLDGTSVASGSITTPAASGANMLFGWLAAPGASKTLNIDDIAINDSTGAANTSYPGSGHVVLLSPISDNAVGTGWTNSAGTGTSLFDCVNNAPPTGIADTTASAGHQIRNATSNANVNYDANMTSYTTAGIVATDTINAVVPWVVTGAPVVTSAKAGTVGVVSNPTIANVSLANAGTFWAGVAAGTYITGWFWTSGTVTQLPTVTLATSPVMRITQVTSSTRIAIVCGMFIYVDYSPAPVVARVPRNPAIDFADPAFV